jgi:hypothetical protein
VPQGQAKTTGTTREIIAFPQADEWIPASAGMTKREEAGMMVWGQNETMDASNCKLSPIKTFMGD